MRNMFRHRLANLRKRCSAYTGSAKVTIKFAVDSTGCQRSMLLICPGSTTKILAQTSVVLQAVGHQQACTLSGWFVLTRNSRKNALTD